MRWIALYFALTYVISWSSFFGAAAISRAAGLPFGSGLSGFVYLSGVFTPAIVALGLTLRQGGRAALIALLRRIIQFPKSAWWYVFAISYIVGIKLTAALLHRLITHAWPQFGTTPLPILIVATLISTPAQSGEEVGWRGYALPRLAARMGLPSASIVLGLLWSFWHLPFFFIPGTDKTGQSVPLYVLQVTALSIAVAWLYWRTDGSLFTAMLLHAAVNNLKDIVPSAITPATPLFAFNASLVGLLTVILLWFSSAYFLVKIRAAKFKQSVVS